jgi:hypothetical protein
MNERSANVRAEAARDSDGMPVETESGAVSQHPAVVLIEDEALERIIGEKQAAVEVDPLGE